MNVLITGIAGFYGHHLAKYILRYKPDWKVIGLDRIDFAGNLNRLKDLPEWNDAVLENRASFIWHDLRAPINDFLANQIGDVEMIFHIAAASHVDRSIADPIGYIMDNVLGTGHILEFARTLEDKLTFFNYFSTDEVFGPLEKDGQRYDEWDRYHAGNPYSATKAGGEELALSYQNTYGVPVVVTHCMNIVGERQHPEKYLPRIIRAMQKGEMLRIHTDDTGKVPSKRHYIYVDNVSSALIFLSENGVPGDKYNIEGTIELDNLEFAQMVEEAYNDGKLKYELVKASTERPGHDWAYGLDGDKLKKMGWTPPTKFKDNLKHIIDWYKENQDWL